MRNLFLFLLVFSAFTSINGQIEVIDMDFSVGQDCMAPASSTFLAAVFNAEVDCDLDEYSWEVLIDFNSDWTYEHQFSSEAGQLDNNYGTPGNEYYLPPSNSGDTMFVTIPIAIEASKYTHRAVWRISDTCGYVYIVTQEFMVLDDTPPVPYCIAETSILFPQVQQVLDIWAYDFVLEPVDNCTQLSDLRYTFTPTLPEDDPSFNSDVGYSTMQLVCQDYPSGIYNFDIYVWDEFDNYDYCTVNVVIHNQCDHVIGDCFTTITGAISTPPEESMGNLSVEISIAAPEFPQLLLTDELGEFDLYFYDSIENGTEDIQVYFDSPNDYLNGVSTLDATIIERHILNIEPIIDPYKLIAADVNNDGAITSLDKLYVDQLITGELDTLPNSTSWRFVNRDLEPTTDSPLVIDNTAIFDVHCSYISLDIIAIKVGDVNCTAIPSFGVASCDTGFKLSGQVSDVCDKPLDLDIQYTLDSDQNGYPKTFAQGTVYDLDCHEGGQDYSLSLTSISDYLNGVSTLDLVLIQKHILAEELFTEAWQYIAADANMDGNVTASDIVELEKLILQEYTELPNNGSYRFFDASSDFVTGDPNSFKEIMDINNLSEDQENLDWIAIKIGDVNCTSTSTGGVSCDAGFNLSGKVFDVCDESLNIDIEYTLESDQSGYPKTFNQAAVYDLDCHNGGQDYSLTLTSNSDYLNGVSTFDLVLIERHILGQELFTEGWQYIAADVNRDGNISTIDMLELEKLILLEYSELPNNSSYRFFDASSGLDIENPNSFVEIMSISNLSEDLTDLNWIGVKVGDVNGTSGAGCLTSNIEPAFYEGFKVSQNQPNPIRVSTTIDFSIPSKDYVSLQIYNITGKEVYSDTQLYQSGSHTWTLDASQLDHLNSGLYFYMVKYKESLISKKMIKQ